MLWRCVAVGLCWLALVSAATAQEPVTRALWQLHSTSAARATVLITNSGWQPIYSLEIEARQGDLLRLIGQTQLTVDLVPEVGQQLRLTVNGEPLGTQSIEINTQPGSHHLPMLVFGLHLVTEDGPLTITLEGSSFHSDAEFAVTVDQQENLPYGSLLAEHYRSYPGLAEAWRDGALLLTEIHHPAPLVQEVWCLQPYVQETLSSVRFAANNGDLLRVSGQAVAVGSLGLEQFSGVLTAEGEAISPYGGQNVEPQNPLAPMLVEGVHKVRQDGTQFLEQRIYGAFGHGLTVQPESARLEVAHFGGYGHHLARFGQEQIESPGFVADGAEWELYSQEIDLHEGDLLRLTGNLQFAPPDSSIPVMVDCQLSLRIDGPNGPAASAFTQKSLTPVRSTLPLTAVVSARAGAEGRYRISVSGRGGSLQGPVPLRLDGGNSQLQYLLFSRPGVVE